MATFPDVPAFYAPNLSASADEGVLPAEESHHAVRVLRLEKSATILLMDGNGTIAQAKITDPHRKHCGYQITKRETVPSPPYHLHLAIAPPKPRDRWETFLEKSTEIGVDEITPLYCQRSERDKVRQDRGERILIAALKQSRNPHKPTLHNMQTYHSFLKEVDFSEYPNKWVADAGGESLLQQSSRYQKPEKVLILVGPEGGFSEDEVQWAREQNYSLISLGNHRYRTETAGLLACYHTKILSQLTRS